MVECGGLENRLARKGHEGSNPSSSAIFEVEPPAMGAFLFEGTCKNTPEVEGFEPDRARSVKKRRRRRLFSEARSGASPTG